MLKKGEGEASPSEELAHFINRETEKNLFNRLLNANANEPLPVLMFYGVGGAGKTWLRRKLWQIARAQVDDFPCALVDFDPLGNSAHLLNDPPQALAQLRYQLGCDCPRFDLAHAMWHHKANGGIAPASSPTKSESGLIDFLSLLARSAPSAAVVAGAIANPLLGLLAGAGVWGGQKMLARLAKLEKELGPDYKKLRTLTIEELQKLLLRRLCEDLDEHLPKRGDALKCRGIIFLDTYEAFDNKAIGDSQRPFLDAWVRDFYEQTESVLFVLCGQNKLKWPEWDDDWKNERYLEQHLIGGLSENDAHAYLFKRRVTDLALREEILKTCRITEEPKDSATPKTPSYHPFSLGVCVDTLYNEKSKRGAWPAASEFHLKAGDETEIINRFLKSLSSRNRRWLERLAVTRRVDETAALSAWEPTHLPGEDAALAWQQAQDWTFLQSQILAMWTLHSHMRDLILSRRDAKEREAAHQFWRAHWSERSQSEIDDFAELAWYHRYHLEPNEALNEWEFLTEELRQKTMMQEHLQIVGWLAPLRVEPVIDDPIANAQMLTNYGFQLIEASLGDRAQNLRVAIACCDEALQEVTRERFPMAWAGTQNNKGRALAQLPDGDSAQNLREAIVCFDASLKEYTHKNSPLEWAMVQSNKGGALSYLPNGDHAANLREAITCYDVVLEKVTRAQFPAQWAMTQNNKGSALAELPDGDRTQNLREAIACYDATLQEHTRVKLPVQWAMTQSNKGIALAQLPDGDRAQNLRAAIMCFDAALQESTRAKFPVDWAFALHNKGAALLGLPDGDRAVNLREAIKAFNGALQEYTRSQFPTQWARTQNNKGVALQNLPTGDRAVNLREAVACFDAALQERTREKFPAQYAETHFNKCLAFADLGKLQEALREVEFATEGYRQANHERGLQSVEDAKQQIQSLINTETRQPNV